MVMADPVGGMVLIGILILGFGFAALCFILHGRKAGKSRGVDDEEARFL
jgi:hypothetical protein